MRFKEWFSGCHDSSGRRHLAESFGAVKWVGTPDGKVMISQGEEDHATILAKNGGGTREIPADYVRGWLKRIGGVSMVSVEDDEWNQEALRNSLADMLSGGMVKATDTVMSMTNSATDGKTVAELLKSVGPAPTGMMPDEEANLRLHQNAQKERLRAVALAADARRPTKAHVQQLKRDREINPAAWFYRYGENRNNE